MSDRQQWIRHMESHGWSQARALQTAALIRIHNATQPDCTNAPTDDED